MGGLEGLLHSPGEQHLLPEKGTSLELPRDLADPLFFSPSSPDKCTDSFTIHTSQYPLHLSEAHRLLNQMP